MPEEKFRVRPSGGHRGQELRPRTQQHPWLCRHGALASAHGTWSPPARGVRATPQRSSLHDPMTLSVPPTPTRPPQDSIGNRTENTEKTGLVPTQVGSYARATGTPERWPREATAPTASQLCRGGNQQTANARHQLPVKTPQWRATKILRETGFWEMPGPGRGAAGAARSDLSGPGPCSRPPPGLQPRT